MDRQGQATKFYFGSHETALFKCVLGSLSGAVDALLAAGADPKIGTSLNVTPLHVAAVKNDVSLIKKLVAAGAPLDAVDKKGNAPIVMAAHVGATEAVSALMELGADVNTRDGRGNPLLHILIASNVEEFVADYSDPAP
ncbi:Ankyrin repeat domain containing protein [Pandoravirus macleodensis]|uniref:Ankyrin repeat domain containing protein n=1 Tax=Pandoravirus macleodensis TaxID=2107707 RepID=A0A2U7UFB4_9VIRU|nr:Ankyrin repeat domain containing protein [Pandoravirus macleodensis]AVK77134.1 Ankyrin repeat domain containing protein [Pandoravirus macleodensis]UMO79845.1 Ankyrin repeat domain containing protein [Pandoravirus aubagnensis]